MLVHSVNSKVAIAGLCFLIYSTVSTELDNMLKPPTDMEPYYNEITAITYAKNQVGLLILRYAL